MFNCLPTEKEESIAKGKQRLGSGRVVCVPSGGYRSTNSEGLAVLRWMALDLEAPVS